MRGIDGKKQIPWKAVPGDDLYKKIMTRIFYLVFVKIIRIDTGSSAVNRSTHLHSVFMKNVARKVMICRISNNVVGDSPWLDKLPL